MSTENNSTQELFDSIDSKLLEIDETDCSISTEPIHTDDINELINISELGLIKNKQLIADNLRQLLLVKGIEPKPIEIDGTDETLLSLYKKREEYLKTLPPDSIDDNDLQFISPAMLSRVKYLDVSKSNINYWLNYKHDAIPNFEKAYRLSFMFNARIEWIFGLSKERILPDSQSEYEVFEDLGFTHNAWFILKEAKKCHPILNSTTNRNIIIDELQNTPYMSVINLLIENVKNFPDIINRKDDDEEYPYVEFPLLDNIAHFLDFDRSFKYYKLPLSKIEAYKSNFLSILQFKNFIENFDEEQIKTTDGYKSLIAEAKAWSSKEDIDADIDIKEYLPYLFADDMIRRMIGEMIVTNEEADYNEADANSFRAVQKELNKIKKELIGKELLKLICYLTNNRTSTLSTPIPPENWNKCDEYRKAKYLRLKDMYDFYNE